MGKSSQGVSVIISTNRPHFFNNILTNYKNQNYPVKELIIVLNKDSMELTKYRNIAKKNKSISVYKVPEKKSLGRCLNYAVSKAKYPFITKFDDDDFYSPFYLTGQMKALHRSHADVVGKRAYLAYLEARKLLVLRFPERQNKFVGLVAGGTILFKRRVFDRVRFPHVSLGEDVSFLNRCRAKGFRIYAPTPYNYVQIRRKHKKSHTWQGSDDYVLKGSRIIARTDQFRKIATRRDP
ncbi:glycosyltransferase family 2 protein [Paenibacillus alginolyticus]|uniref:Glycosyltransferase family 2 protein n=1 Tax=Paenibacillus alginolyticus TaxID=59839 RepID=A0ABT4GGD8_9BACL|nr:glycosyltransferase family A protein [Paenibacillus alginolyticus]MCY9667086.1 glycosyltransferase family 2 protein [Paenibacillus alginolyticus]MCY9695118.1 glycosyltransferase family 2 protein [Paenibacillus alginolyticus]MEC0147949.1 glycosyltransferase family A protein [Paenibacillus alginolyticus]